MADEKLTELTEETSPAGTDLVYVVTDPDGTPASRKVKIENLPGGGGGGGDKIESVDGDDSATVETKVVAPGNGTASMSARTLTGEAGFYVDAFGSAGYADLAVNGQGVLYAEEDGTGVKLGFFGGVGVTQPQIDGSTATVADLCAALHALGLIEDTSL